MSAAIDINSTRQHWPQYSSEDHEEARRAAMHAFAEDYIERWCDGDLYDDGDTYSGPQERFMEACPSALGELLKAYRSGDQRSVEHVAGRMARAMEGIVRDQAQE